MFYSKKKSFYSKNLLLMLASDVLLCHDEVSVSLGLAYSLKMRD